MRNITLIIIALCALLTLVSVAYATEIPTNVTVDFDPVVSTISLADSDGGTLQVWANDSRAFNCTGTITDNDGFADIQTVNATIWGFNSSFAGTDSAGVHYTNTSCTKYSASGNTTSYTCTFIVHHQTQNGTWTCNVSVNDSYTRSATNQTTNTVDIFKSLTVPTQTIAFGAYAHGQNSGTTDNIVVVNNTGNVKINISLDAYRSPGVPNDNNSMTCTSGTLPVGSIVYATSAGVTALSKTALVNNPTNVSANIQFTAYGATTPISYSVYLGIVIPNNASVAGACNGLLDISAI